MKTTRNAFDPSSYTWMWSRKLDGVRVIMRIENGTVKYFSRQGKEFFTLGNVTDAIATTLYYERKCCAGR